TVPHSFTYTWLFRSHNHDDFRLSAAHRTNSFASDHTTPADLCLKTSRIFLFTAVFQKNVWHFRVVRRCAYPTHIHIKTTLSRDDVLPKHDNPWLFIQ